jgi:transposase
VSRRGSPPATANIAADHPRVTKAWVTGYRTKVVEHDATLGIDVEVTRRDPAQRGFKVIPRRWVVERTFGWLMHHRRLARDYETRPHRSESRDPGGNGRPHKPTARPRIDPELARLLSAPSQEEEP